MKKMRKTIAFLLMLVLMLAAAPASFAEDTEAIDSEPLITDLRYIPGENADELWTHVGYSFLLGNGSSQEGNSFEVTYSDGTMKIFKYAYYKDYGDGGRLQTFLDLFENGVVSKDSEGRYKTLHVSSIIDDTSHAGISKVRFRVYSGNEYVYSSESYDVQVYGAMSSIKYEAPLTSDSACIDDRQRHRCDG